ARSRPRLADEAHAVHLVAVAAADEPLLEREEPRRRLEPGAQLAVGRREERCLDSRGLAESPRHRRERLSRAERLRPHQVEADVTVTEAEPALAAPAAGGGERLPRLAGASPAPLLVVQIGRAHV